MRGFFRWDESVLHLGWGEVKWGEEKVGFEGI